jgi:hypothetical protein
MSVALFSLNQDLNRLRDEGYFVQIEGGSLVMREVPYVNAQREVKMGKLISSLCLEMSLRSRNRTLCNSKASSRVILMERPYWVFPQEEHLRLIRV